jgi:hypothetical protein
MPIVGSALDCVIYLYRNKIDANNGARSGGSGFLVGVESVNFPGSAWVYAVTNAHVIKEKFPIIRLNKKDGTAHIEPLKMENWIVSKTDDLAICRLEMVDTFQYNVIMYADFLSDTIQYTREIGPGDEVMMLGRFIGHDGIQTNRPVARTGIISMMPAVEIEKKDGTKQLSYLVECKSISGFSGSPVLVYRPWSEPGFVNLTPEILPKEGAKEYRAWLLGVDWCHLPINEPVYETKDGKLEKTQYTVLTNSGFAGIVPASRLRDLLDSDDVKKKRIGEEMAREKTSTTPNAAVEDFASEPTQKTRAPKEEDRIDIPIPTRKQFERDLLKATRKRDKK